jgi:hypothetical protein
MTAREAASWRRFLRVHGKIGFERLDAQLAMLTKSVVDCHADEESRQPMDAYYPQWKVRDDTDDFDADEYYSQSAAESMIQFMLGVAKKQR